MSYVPKRIAFKFPGEWTVNDVRPDGEMVIMMDQVTENDSKSISTSNGLNLVLPLMFDPTAPANPDLESLNFDFWRSELTGKENYIPKDPKTNKKVKLNLERLVKSFMDVKPDFGYILGSQTIPPCIDYVYHVVAFSPLKVSNCQFKQMREGSLLTEKLKETHARRLQNDPYMKPGDQKQINFDQVQPVTNLSSLVSQRQMKAIQDEIVFSDPAAFPLVKGVIPKPPALPTGTKSAIDEILPNLSAAVGCVLERIVNSPKTTTPATAAVVPK